MKRQHRKRIVYLSATTLRNGTVLAAHPVRKPSSRIMKRDGLRVDDDGVVIVFTGNYTNALCDSTNESRYRFIDIISNNLNTRRALREIIVPQLTVLQMQVEALRSEIVDLKSALASRNHDPSS